MNKSHHLTRCSHTPGDAFIILLCCRPRCAVWRVPVGASRMRNSGYRPSAVFIHTVVALLLSLLLLLLLTHSISATRRKPDGIRRGSFPIVLFICFYNWTRHSETAQTLMMNIQWYKKTIMYIIFGSYLMVLDWQVNAGIWQTLNLKIKIMIV